jgi:aryl-alcohol dehydrogenase-like predicted oxidoreductase
MEYRKLGNTEIEVSAICLGTMTWGQQNTKLEAFEQMDYATGEGINFIDTAEMYPVPPNPDTATTTEQYIGDWLRERGNRESIVLATKVTGRGDVNPGVSHFRDGPRLSRTQVRQALDDSLHRLRTDYVDLYQLHWPERKTNFFGKLGYVHEEDDDAIPIEETLDALGELVREGKVRAIGLSNETPWGLMEFLRQAENKALPRVVSIQNPYSLVNRTFEVGLAEMAIREQVGLLAYSPLAFGTLSGKYLRGQQPANTRLTLFERFSRYNNPRNERAVGEYVALAEEHGLDPAQMALAYTVGRPFVTSAIIGATTMDQLRANIASAALTLPEEVMAGIETIHSNNPNPAP